MSKFYGMIQGGRGEATHCGHRFIKSAVQSYDGSVITELEYNEIGELLVKRMRSCRSFHDLSDS